ncbi:hypothetical protein D3C74_334940 [compost metagenome]
MAEPPRRYRRGVLPRPSEPSWPRGPGEAIDRLWRGRLLRRRLGRAGEAFAEPREAAARRGQLRRSREHPLLSGNDVTRLDAAGGSRGTGHYGRLAAFLRWA